MTAIPQPISPPSRTLLLLEGRAMHELGAFMLLRPWLAAAPRGDGHPVLVSPGCWPATSPPSRCAASSRPRATPCTAGSRAAISACGRASRTRCWRASRSCTSATDGRKLSLVGWSLGGIYARQLAKRLPDKVRSVISLGSPFAGSPKATNAWKVYELASGQSVEDHDHHPAGPLADPPPVPTTSIFSRSDGICAWQTCLNDEGAEVENIEVYGSHCGLAPPSGRRLCRRRPAGPARRPVEEVRPLGLAELRLSRLASFVGRALTASSRCWSGSRRRTPSCGPARCGRLRRSTSAPARRCRACWRSAASIAFLANSVCLAMISCGVAARLVFLHHRGDVLHRLLEDGALLVGDLARRRSPSPATTWPWPPGSSAGAP